LTLIERELEAFYLKNQLNDINLYLYAVVLKDMERKVVFQIFYLFLGRSKKYLYLSVKHITMLLVCLVRVSKDFGKRVNCKY
jgi:hypothetical protein